MGSGASPEKDGFWAENNHVINSPSGVNSKHSVHDLLDELERLKKNNSEMQQVIDQLTEEIQLRDRTVS